MSNNYHTTDFRRCDVAADTCGCGCAPVAEDTACTLPLHDECTCQMPVRDDCGCGCSCESKPDCCAGVEPDTTSKLPSCCKGSMLSALRMLFRNPLSRYMDFNQVAVLTDGAVLGSYLTRPYGMDESYDNLATTLTGTLGRVSSGTCDLLDVKGPVYTPAPIPENSAALSQTLTGAVSTVIANVDPSASTELGSLVDALRALYPQLTADSTLVNQLQAGIEAEAQLLADDVTKVSTCAVEAVAIDVMPGASAADEQSNYDSAKQILLRMLGNGSYPPFGPCPPYHCPPYPCPPYPCPPFPGPGPRPPRPRPWYEVEAEEDDQPRCRCVCEPECDPCSCTQGVLDRLVGEDGTNSGVTLTAGNLALYNVDVLGSVNNVIVLANDTDKRFYFVCAQNVGFMN